MISKKKETRLIYPLYVMNNFNDILLYINKVEILTRDFNCMIVPFYLGLVERRGRFSFFEAYMYTEDSLHLQDNT